MIGKTPASTGQQFYRDADKVTADRNAQAMCSQTGEEFSTEFLRECLASRRIMDQNQQRQMDFSFCQNQQVVKEDPRRIHRLKRIDSECDSFDFVPVTEYKTEVENRAYHDNVGRYNCECLPNGQKTGDCDDELNTDQAVPAPSTPSKYVLESPQSYHPFETIVSNSSLCGKMKLLCSFGGRILPRPNDGKLRYVGGETRIISITKNLAWEELVKKTSALCNQAHTIKYQLPGEDLDALISVCSDEDLHHMIDEYQDPERNGGSQRLRIFLVSSCENDSSGSFEGRTPRQSDADYQYVSAVNGMLDASPHKSSSGHSLSTQCGTNSDGGPNFQSNTPVSVHALENKDCSTTHSKLAGTHPNPAAHFFTTYQVHSKSFSQSPPVSPVKVCHQDHNNSKLQFYVDPSWPNGNESFSTVDKTPFDNTHHLNASAFNSNFYPANLALKNYHHGQQYLRETDQNTKGFEMHFHNRTPSGDFLLRQLHTKSDMNLERPLRERALSDSQLQDHDEGIKCCLEEAVFPPSLWNGRREKSTSLAMSTLSQEPAMIFSDIVEEKYQLDRGENQISFKTMVNTDLNQEVLNWMDKSFNCPDDGRKQYHGNFEDASNLDAMEYINLPPSPDYVSKVHCHLQDVQESGRKYGASMVKNMEFSVKLKQTPGLQSDTDAYQQYHMIERMSDQPVSQGHLGDLKPPLKGAGNGEHQVQISKTVTTASSRVTSSYDEELVTDRIVETIHITEQSYKETMVANALYVQSQPSSNNQANKVLESVVIVEDVTGSVPPDIPFSKKVIPRVEEEAELKSNRDYEEKDLSQDSEPEELEVEGRDMDDAAMAEIEAGIYGLQIIKNADIEELRELGSGTFGTVYYGKWRGTDVAIKRIKKSCFAGRTSEQDRLMKDFWREAQILSNLHHPNIVAFYGVVPDGPGGTMATVTEYMVNGSLRNVLQRKDRGLDRRKKLMIALDAAFGMEYLHLKHIVHFDLKCDNLLVNLRDSQRPICKVGDFGLSRIKRNTLVSGGVRGTLPWIAPELLDGNSNRVSEKVDVYSFGISMWEILTGEEPYANMHCGTIIGGIVSNTLRPPIPEQCDPEWRKLMEQCWSFDPAARPTFTEITNRLRTMTNALQPKRRNFANR